MCVSPWVQISCTLTPIPRSCRHWRHGRLTQANASGLSDDSAGTGTDRIQGHLSSAVTLLFLNSRSLTGRVTEPTHTAAGVSQENYPPGI
ncbi:hypothetical protein XENTR_v10000352 [Xenopus tropicalis]|nr:hypothetical protein XENTR_v10000352 [Xenopus tropicalis]